MNEKSFVAFILTHGRADNVKTYKTLRKHGYTGRIVLVVDNEDSQAEKYIKNYGTDDVVIFDKKAVSDTMDEGDNFEERKVIIYARNECFNIAKNLGYKFFIELDDDYVGFSYRFSSKGVFKGRLCYQLDAIFDMMVEFFNSDKRIMSVAMSQSGDYIGGEDGTFGEKIKLHRKCMNSFVCSVDRPFQFIGRINEDVTTYTTLGGRGMLFFTLPNICLYQTPTQQNKGGMTDVYLASGTYLKSFYSVMYSPSCVKIHTMGDVSLRLHHQVMWKNAVPKILREEWKKK